MVEQLKKSQESFILSLLLSSEEQKDTFLKFLNEPHITEGFSTKDVENIVGQVIANDTFTETNLP